MSFFAALKKDIETVVNKVRGATAAYFPAAVSTIHTDILDLLQRVVTYVEEHLPEVEAVAVGAAEKLAGPAGAAVAAVAPIVEKVVNAEVTRVAAAAPAAVGHAVDQVAAKVEAAVAPPAPVVPHVAPAPPPPVGPPTPTGK